MLKFGFSEVLTYSKTVHTNHNAGGGGVRERSKNAAAFSDCCWSNFVEDSAASAAGSFNRIRTAKGKF